jgi:hypothetical protein
MKEERMNTYILAEGFGEQSLGWRAAEPDAQACRVHPGSVDSIVVGSGYTGYPANISAGGTERFCAFRLKQFTFQIVLTGYGEALSP